MGMLGVFRARGKFGIQYTLKNGPVAPCRPKIISHRLKSIQQHQKSISGHPTYICILKSCFANFCALTPNLKWVVPISIIILL